MALQIKEAIESLLQSHPHAGAVLLVQQSAGQLHLESAFL